MTEFELIARYFERPARSALVGQGDDAAVIAPSPEHAFVVTTDNLVLGRHFLPRLTPQRLGRRLVAVNLSDLAAMAATPRFALLGLTLPEADPAWAAAFAEGLFAALDEAKVELIGGNTTRGPLAVGMTVFGEVPLAAGRPLTLLRSGAQPGDDVWVSGALGDAGWACLCLLGRIPATPAAHQIERYEQPEARVGLGLAIRHVATSAIDISDGLVSEARHVARASGVAIDIEAVLLPTGLGAHLDDPATQSYAWHCLLATGDAYELLFTAPPGARSRIEALLAEHAPEGRRIGYVRTGNAPVGCVRVLDRDGVDRAPAAGGWDHFSGRQYV